MIFPSQSTMEVQISSKKMQDHGAFRYIILYIGKTNQISPLLTITSIIRTDRVGSENVYTQAL